MEEHGKRSTVHTTKYEFAVLSIVLTALDYIELLDRDQLI